jgi:hypothetical protein
MGLCKQIWRRQRPGQGLLARRGPHFHHRLRCLGVLHSLRGQLDRENLSCILSFMLSLNRGVISTYVPRTTQISSV